MRHSINSEDRFFRDNPVIAARYFLPAVGALVGLYGSTTPGVVREVVRMLEEAPCPAWAIRQVLGELRAAPPEPTVNRIEQRLLDIPESFWDAVYREMEETPTRQGANQ